jgi:hypothetical protein
MTKFNSLVKFEDTLSSLASATEREVSSVTEVYAGPPFRSFAQAQIPPVTSILTDLATKQQTRLTSVKQAVTADATLKKDVQPLKVIHSDIVEKQKKHAELIARFDKAAKAAASADEKHQKLKAKNPASPDTRRLMNERDILFSKRDAIAAEVETSERNLQLSRTIYKKQLFESMLNAFERFANEKKAQAEAQQVTVQEIATLGASIREHTEPVPEAIKVELAELRAAKFA